MENKLKILLSLSLRIREIKFKEKFPYKENLYPGEYIKELAYNIINTRKNITLIAFKIHSKNLEKFSLDESMSLIKKDLKNLGVVRDNFFSETDLINRDLVKKSIKTLKNKNFVEEGFLDPPKESSLKIGKK